MKSEVELGNKSESTTESDNSPVKQKLQECENDEKPLQIDTSGDSSKNDAPEAETLDASAKNVSKRSAASSETNTTPSKKVRSKPKPQIVENMKEHVDNNTIDKLTTTTLMHWLKEQSVYCTTRDKKADLILKVKNHFVVKES